LRYREAIDVALYIQPHDQRAFLRKSKHQIAMDEATLERDHEAGLLLDSRKRARLRDNMQLVEAIEQDMTLPFQIMLVMTIRAKSLKDLHRITDGLERSMSSLSTRQCDYRHRQGFDTTLPLFNNELGDMHCLHTLHTQALMASFPFSSNDITHENGVLIGVSQMTHSPIILNRFMQPQIESPNTAILGASGSGKSFFAKLEMLRWVALGKPVIVLDPSGEYARICEAVGGANININADSGDRINPLDFSHAVAPKRNALRDKVTYLVEFVGVLVHEDKGDGLIYDAVSKKLVSNALQEVYRRYGYIISDVTTQQAATSKNMPILSDVHVMLSRIGKTNRDPEVQKRLQPLLAALERYVGEGDLATLFDNRTTVDTRSHFINFNYHGLQQEYLPMAMHLVLEFIRTSMFTDQQRESGVNRLLYIDEAQILMGFPETAHFLEYTARTCRKFGIGLTVMTQNVGVFVSDANGEANKVGQAILGNCSIKILLKQEPSEADAVSAAFRLTEGELSRLLASRAEHAMLTTTTSERAQINEDERLLTAAAELTFDDGNSYFVEEDHMLPAGEVTRVLGPGSAVDPFEQPFSFDDE
jgi:type IV secretory pathway VirB4 component